MAVNDDECNVKCLPACPTALYGGLCNGFGAGFEERENMSARSNNCLHSEGNDGREYPIIIVVSESTRMTADCSLPGSLLFAPESLHAS